MGIENPGGEDEVAGLIDLGKYVKSPFLGFFKRGMIGVLVLDRFRLVKDRISLSSSAAPRTRVPTPSP